MRKLIGVTMALAIVAGMGWYVQAAGKKPAKPKYTIKQIMKMAHDKEDGLLTKVTEGKASKKDKQKLLALYVALAGNKPPKGDQDSWKEKTSAILAVAKQVVAGKDGADEKLGETVNCGGCHKAHKGS